MNIQILGLCPDEISYFSWLVISIKMTLEFMCLFGVVFTFMCVVSQETGPVTVGGQAHQGV